MYYVCVCVAWVVVVVGGGGEGGRGRGSLRRGKANIISVNPYSPTPPNMLSIHNFIFLTLYMWFHIKIFKFHSV